LFDGDGEAGEPGSGSAGRDLQLASLADGPLRLVDRQRRWGAASNRNEESDHEEQKNDDTDR
jgi:hypothetical protein